MQEKKDFLFRFVDHTTRHKLLLDEEAIYSTTDQVTADKITKDLLKLVSKHSTITDATACIGGNTYSFAQVFKTVNAYEKDQVRARMLAANMETLGMKNVKCQCGDAIDIVPTYHHDVVFIDPPWGGPDYKSQARVSLTLSDTKLSTVCNEFAHVTKYIALKVPINFDEALFISETKESMELVLKDTQLRKMKLLVFKTSLWNWERT